MVAEDSLEEGKEFFRMDLFSEALEDIVDDIDHRIGHGGLLVFFDEWLLRRTPVFLENESQVGLDTFRRIRKNFAFVQDS